MFNFSEVAHAYHVTEDFDEARNIAHICAGRVVEEIDPLTGEKTPGINVETLRGVKRASNTDYIIENVYGEYEVVNEKTYLDAKNSQ